MKANAIVEVRNTYGTIETNGLVNGYDYHAIDRELVCWTSPGLKITRLRLVADRGYPNYDVSYCHGEIDGVPVRVELPFMNIPVRNAMGFLIQEAKRDGVYAKGIGILNQGNWSILR